MTENHFSKLFGLYKEYYKTRIIENEHLIQPSFHLLASSVVKPKYIFGGEYKNCKTDLFIVQQSGTGKSEILKATKRLTYEIGFKSEYVDKFTEAGIIGSITENKQGIVPQPGLLKDNHFLGFDEARPLLEPNQHSQDLLSTMCGFLDDRYVHKRLKAGSLKYFGNAVIGTGTFPYESMRTTFVETGLLQRFNFRYKTYTSTEIHQISKKFDSLSNVDWFHDVLPIVNKIKTFVNELIQKQEKYKHIHNDKPKYYIKIPDEVSSNFGTKVDNFFANELMDTYSDDNVQTILNTFLIRSKTLGHKLMTHHSVINNEDKVTQESADYSYLIVEEHLKNVNSFISDILELDCFGLKNYNSTERKSRQTIMAILNWVKN